ncbi:hypothetical protein HCJ52_10735 [Listeria sp. FSL L7-1485]|uniref:Uncharacterized protein n=1 Tax=Listeria immobilis TaxID=2713502 RepID=A0A7X0X8E1_9LIST|nr:hypothetical protein [Listeria immobilis]MBC1483757.1 hypothetical protein [Listeria immobilis]MBC1489531.1 hypothetical protein [Listeria immobilis]MBC1507974.1 hypothetical protein [Listeria immobilis]MBC1510961.1 hypothetical protein [Listeria immobilis]MBC1536601.1 hypothetical protein [Listeria immobilis]
MHIKNIYIRWIPYLLIITLIFLITTQSLAPFAVIYSITAAVLLVYLWLSKSKIRTKLILSLIYLVILALQQVLAALYLFSGGESWMFFTIKKVAAILIIFVPFLVGYFYYLYTLQREFSIKEATSISFEMLREVYLVGTAYKTKWQKSKNSFSKDNLNEILKDIPRHSYTKYLNKNTLTEAYFEECTKSLNDKHLYIVISSTGSPASEVISLFTNKTYNHVSLSFDRDLKTTISYNGGENITMPGLNPEKIISFNKKSDASVMVYQLEISKEKKQLIIDKIKEINEKGSAYNLVGLVTKVSLRPNIMFCSQFVYNILRFAQLEYFQDSATKIKPTDFVERDYYRKLAFCYEIKFNEQL